MASFVILIVDDEPSNLATLQQILRDDYTLVFARSGGECLAAAQKHHPALILLDIQLPDMDGYQVCRLLKHNPVTETTPIIFVSALGDVGNEAAGFECGAVDYIVKPVSPAIVRARIRTHLSLVRATTLERYVKQLEIERAKTARLSRILAVLSETNSTIVRVREQQALVEEACHIAVEQGGFGAAWIGMGGAGGRVLTMAASQGLDADQPAPTMPVALEPDGQEEGIPEQVLRTGTVALCNDVRAISDEDRTCGDARRRGYLSIIGLPLTVNDQLAGVMVLYAREANYFDDEELKLLGELAGDISFALRAIESERRASFLSYYDPLTGLPNTALFLDRLDQLVQAARREHTEVFVIVINVERFKQLNDSHGRHVGDQVLRITANRLEEGFARLGSVARLGSDNFVLAGTQATNEAAGGLCEEIRAALREPMLIEHRSLHLSVRMGVAVFPADAQDGEALFKNAEVALKQCKLGQAPYLFYSPEINARLAEKAVLESMLRIALEARQFVLHYQPKVDLTTGRVTGAEALIRWQHPERGLVSPMDFIALAEETGLIVPMGEWVIRAVCAQQAAWLRDGVPAVPVALNLSALQFREADLLGVVLEALSDHDLEPGWVELELTESLVMQNPQEAQRTMRAFREHGLRLSLDDFGTGYSSLAYLKRFPFDTVKIDRVFVTDITHNPDDAAIASAIIAMAHSLRMRVVAEGVETEAQLMFLRARHCDQIQGYYFSRPVPANEFESMLCTGRHLTLQSDPEPVQQTLLLVDDDQAILSALKRALRGQGYRVLAAPSGPEALELLAVHAAQVIVCDQRMAKTTGRDFLTVVAKLYPDTMRIVLGECTELKSMLDVINRGEIYRFLTKPWDDDLLRENIREAFRRYRPGAEMEAFRRHEP